MVEVSTPANGRKVIRVIYDLVRDHKWHNMDDELMYRFLNLYRDSVLPNDASDFSHLKKGLEVCIRRMLKNMCNDDLLKVVSIIRMDRQSN